MKYTVVPATVENCECEDCKAGRYFYNLFSWEDNKWQWAATSLQSYSNAQECKRHHYWGIKFEPEDTWEDATPIVEPEPVCYPEAQPGQGGMVELDKEALAKAAEAFKKHMLPQAPTGTGCSRRPEYRRHQP
jgi:hypothetical protein